MILALLLAISPGDKRILFDEDGEMRTEHVSREGMRAGERGGPSLAYFEFAPLSGAGMGQECGTATVTGAKGEALTFTRASSAYCTAGNQTTGITNGAMTLLTTNKPRVTTGGSGVKGLLVEGARTNSVLRSEEFDNAAWLLSGYGGPAPTRTANYGVAPDGTNTADRLQVSAASGPEQQLMIYQNAVCPVGTSTASVYLKGVSGSGAVDLVTYGPGTCKACSFNSSTWTRCTFPTTVSGSAAYIGIGNDTQAAFCGTPLKSAVDVLVWGAQCESGAYASSYIPTTSAAVARAVDVGSVALTAAPGMNVSSLAATIVPIWSTAHSIGSPIITHYRNGATDRYHHYSAASSGTSWSCNPNNDAVGYFLSGAAAKVLTAWTPYRSYCMNSTNATGAFDGVSMSASSNFTGTFTGPTFIDLGHVVSVNQIDGVLKQVCFDSNPSRCR